MKLKIQLSEGFHTWILKKSIEIDTDNYPELQGMEEEQVLEYLKENSDNMDFNDGEKTYDGWSLHDELVDQEPLFNKEKNYATDIHLDGK
jgi:hypothetical protein